jgi:hypothetical protein
MKTVSRMASVSRLFIARPNDEAEEKHLHLSLSAIIFRSPTSVNVLFRTSLRALRVHGRAIALHGFKFRGAALQTQGQQSHNEHH